MHARFGDDLERSGPHRERANAGESQSAATAATAIQCHARAMLIGIPIEIHKQRAAQP